MTAPAATDPMKIARTVRVACVQAALDGYERAQIAGLCHEGAWEVAVDAIRMLDLKAIVDIAPVEDAPRRQSPGPASV